MVTAFDVDGDGDGDAGFELSLPHVEAQIAQDVTAMMAKTLRIQNSLAPAPTAGEQDRYPALDALSGTFHTGQAYERRKAFRALNWSAIIART
jgi:hypothetical protein